MSDSTSRKNLKVAIQELLKWKEHFKNLLENTPEITDKQIQKNNYEQLDVKLGQFTVKELDAVLKKNEKLKSCRKILPQNLMTSAIMQLRLLTKHDREIDETLHPSFPQER